MTTFLSSVLVAIVSAIFWALLTRYIAKRQRTSFRPRTIITRSRSGKVDSLTVPGDASESEITNYVITNIKLENSIAQQIRDLQKTIRNMQVHEGKFVDIIASHQGKKIAIEIKNNLDRVDIKAINRYMNEESGIDRLLIISTAPAPKRLLNAASDLIDSGRMNILKVDPASPSDTQKLTTAVKDAFHLAQV